MDTWTLLFLELAGRRRRRKHSAEFKAELIRACQQLGVSSAAIALAHGLNANMLRRWVNSAEQMAPLVRAMREDLLGRRVLHADETPVAMLKPGLGKTHRAYLWSYCTTA